MFVNAKIKLGKNQSEGQKQVKVSIDEKEKRYYIQKRVNFIKSKQERNKKEQTKKKSKTCNDPALRAQIMQQIERFEENLNRKNINMSSLLTRRLAPLGLDKISECSECSIDSLSGVTWKEFRKEIEVQKFNEIRQRTDFKMTVFYFVIGLLMIPVIL